MRSSCFLASFDRLQIVPAINGGAPLMASYMTEAEDRRLHEAVMAALVPGPREIDLPVDVAAAMHASRLGRRAG